MGRLLLCCVLVGCYKSHERDDPITVDAARDAAVDAPVPADVGPPLFDASMDVGIDAPPVRVCRERVRPPLDVVFVLDYSSSMFDEIEALIEGAVEIWEAAHALTDDVNIGLVIFVDNHVAARGCAPFDSAGDFRSELRRWTYLLYEDAQPASDFLNNQDCVENSIDALYAAAEECSWRADSHRVVIYASDFTFVERPSVLSFSIPVAHTYTEVLDVYRDRQIRLGAFFPSGFPDGESHPCRDTTNGAGFHTPYQDMPAIPQATGGRAYDLRLARQGRLDLAGSAATLIDETYCVEWE